MSNGLIQFSNNVSSKLAAEISAGAGSLSVLAGTGDKFPAIGGGQFFYCTLVDASNNIEVVKVTARSGDVFTVERGQDGTTARLYPSQSYIGQLIPRAVLQAFLQDNGGSATGDYSWTGTSTFVGSIKVSLPAGSPRIIGNLHDTIAANRLLFQTDALNNPSSVGVLPNGATAQPSGFSAYSQSNPANSQILNVVISTAAAKIESTRSAGAAFVPIEFWTNGEKQLEIGITGAVRAFKSFRADGGVQAFANGTATPGVKTTASVELAAALDSAVTMHESVGIGVARTGFLLQQTRHRAFAGGDDWQSAVYLQGRRVDGALQEYLTYGARRLIDANRSALPGWIEASSHLSVTGHTELGYGLSSWSQAVLRVKTANNTLITGNPAPTGIELFGNISSTLIDGVVWRRADNNIGVAGVLAQVTAQGSFLQLRTSNNYNTGLTTGAYVDYLGNVVASGNIFVFSDERLKKVIGKVKLPANWRDLLKPLRYRRKDHGDVQVGVMAQAVRKVLPECTSVAPDGTAMVDYGRLALMLLLAGAEE